MKRISVDFNSREGTERYVIDIKAEGNKHIADLAIGEAITLYDDEMEVDAIVEKGQFCEFVGLIDRKSIRDLK